MKLKSFIVPILLVMLLISGCAGATVQQQQSSDINVKETVQNIITLQFLVDLGVLKGTIDPMEGFTRFILLILLFALLFRGLEALAGLGRGTSVAVALVIALMTVIFIPGTVLLAAATSYGTLFSLLLMLVPVGLGVAAYWFLKDNPWVRVVIMAILAFILSEMSKYMGGWVLGFVPGAPAGSEITGGYGGVIQAVVNWIDWVFWIVIVLLVWNLISALFGAVTGHSGAYSNKLKNVVKGMAERGYQNFKNKAPRAAKAALREHIEEEEELEKLNAVEESITFFEEHVRSINDYGGFETAADHTDVKGKLDLIKERIKAAKEQIRSLIRKTRGAENKLGNLLNQLHEKKFDTAPLEVLEKQILANHKTCVDKLDEAIKVFGTNAFGRALREFYSFSLSSRAFPYKFGKPVPPNNILLQREDDSDALKGSLDELSKAVTLISDSIGEAKKAEENAKEELERVIAETEKLLA